MGDYIWPVPGSRISSKFGQRIHPITRKRSFHGGVDLAAGHGTPIYATKGGTVTAASEIGSYGNCVLLNHGDGTHSRYAHASSLLVSKGQTVKAGQMIAKVGSTGRSTGNHCHFEIIVGGTRKNPLSYVSSKDTAANYSSAQPGKSASTTQTAQAEAQSEEKNKEITSVVIKSVNGSSSVQNNYITALPGSSKGVEIIIQNNGNAYSPCLEGNVKLDRERKGSPAKLSFSVVCDEILNFQEGNPVSFRYNGEKIFLGFVFSKSRKDKNTISVVAYDQMRYLKNKDTLSYTNKKYSELLKMVAVDYGLKFGEVADTGYSIPQRIEECSVLEMLGNASDETVLNTGKLFVLYDDYGFLTLKALSSMKLPIVIDEDVAESFDYTSTIDNNTYNRIKLAVDNGDTGQREVRVTNDAATQSKWGILQYYEKMSEGTNVAIMEERAKVLLGYYNKKHRQLKISNAFGDIRVRGGSLIVVNMSLGDIDVRNYMCVESVKHTFSNGNHTMDLTLSGFGGEFIP